MFSLILNVGEDAIFLFGPDIVEPVKGCRRKPGKDLGETFQEELDIILQGAPGSIDAFIRSVEIAFSRIRLGQAEAVLALVPDLRETPHKSKVLAGSIAFLGHGSADRMRGGMGICLTITRENFWEGALRAVALSNVHGNNQPELLVDNSFAAGRNPFATIVGSTISGELPAPARVRIENVRAGKVYAEVYLGEGFQGLGELPYFEGESGLSEITSGVVPDASSSGGAYTLVQWSGTAEVESLYWVIDHDLARWMDGRVFRPVVRFAAAPGADYWVRWGVQYGEALEVSAWQKLESGKCLQALPAVHVPPVSLGNVAVEDVRLSLFCRRDVSGGHSLAVDFVYLMAVDGWRSYTSLGSGGLAVGERLVDERGMVTSEATSTGRWKMTHQGIGKGIWMVPGVDMYLAALMGGVGGSCAIDDQVKLKVEYSPRRKNL
jgi:hypothetical protein